MSVKKDKVRAVQVVLALFGLIVSTYLTLVHYIGLPLACSDSGIINCNAVINSQYAYVFSLPIAAYGIIFFVVELALLYKNNPDSITIWNLVGIGAVAYFLAIEYIVGHICIFCTGVHVTVLLLLILSIYQMRKK